MLICPGHSGGLVLHATEAAPIPVLDPLPTALPPARQAVGDVCFGSVMGPSSQRANECRIAMFLAGFPTSVPVHTVNRQCSSGA